MDEQKAVMMIEFGVTRQPRDYQSVRVGVNVPVFVGPFDDVQALLERHLTMAKWAVRAQVDDEFEQGHERPASYSPEPRFGVMLVHDEKLAVIAPVVLRKELPEAWLQHSVFECWGHREGFILQKITEDWPRYTVVDVTDGDLAGLPPLNLYVVYRYRRVHEDEPKFWVLAQKSDPFEGYEKDLYPGSWYRTTHFRRLVDGGLLAELTEAAAKEGAVLYDCTDGDFSKLPPPAPTPDDPFPDDEDDPDSEDDNDYEDYEDYEDTDE